jgi:hypothetical protein
MKESEVIIPPQKRLLMIGWREWVTLPALQLNMIKAKVDTGARTCTLHAFELEEVIVEGVTKIRFCIHPKQHNDKEVVTCISDIADKRVVSDSGGHKEERYVIVQPVRLGNTLHKVEITLTNRDSMRFRMLLGRNFLRKGYGVNPAASFLMGLPKRKENT